jgi:spore maturation protein SpmB
VDRRQTERTGDGFQERIKTGVCAGIRKGWGAFLWMIKILVPISLLTTVLAWFGWIGQLVVVLKPVMGVLHLPAESALPIIIGMFTNIYGAIAAMVALPFTKEQMTLMAIFVLTAHSLIQESVIQGKSGLHPIKAFSARLIAAFLTTLCVAPFLETGDAVNVLPETVALAEPSFFSMLVQWAFDTVTLSVKIFGIIMVILTLLEVVKALGWMQWIVRFARPLLRILGLSHRVGFLWMTAAVFGLSYGAAVIVEEAKEGHMTPEELESLQLSIGINHSLVEDPALFLSLGLSAFWIWVPRLLMAMVAVRILTWWQSFRIQRNVRGTP